MKKALGLLLFLLGCAKFGPPPGGPEDKTPPEVASVLPASGSIRVDSTTFIEFVFSKKVEKMSLARNVFISPALPDSFRDELKGKTYRILPRRNLTRGVTYVVTLGTGIRDLRGNTLAQAYSFSFSTGESIDSGEIAGQLFEKTAPVLGAAVKLYRVSDSLAPLDWKRPAYQTTSGTSGRFKFSFLPPGRYRILAEAQSKFALYHRDVTALKMGGKQPPFQLFLDVLDTASLKLVDARMNRDRLLVLTFNKTPDFPDTALSHFRISGAEVKLQSAFANPGEKEKLYLTGEFPLVEKEAVLFFSPSSTQGISDSSRFLITASPDKTPPRLVFSDPSNRSERRGVFDTLKLFFSEPVTLNSNESGSGLFDSLDATVPTIWSSPQTNALYFALSKPLRTGEWHRFRLPAGTVADRAGNLFHDSLLVFFRTYFPDSLGSVSGRVWGAKRGETVLEFRELSSGWSKKITVQDSIFSVPLLSGKYFLSGFSDLNRNEKREPGSLSPFRFSESAFFYPDTVFVRARFETEGVEIEVLE